MRHLLPAIVLLLALPPATHAASIVLIADARLVEVDTAPPLGGVLVPSAPFADFDVRTPGVGFTNSAQTSTIGTAALVGRGDTGHDGGGGVFARSVFDVTFQVDEATGFELDYLLASERPQGATAELSGPGAILFSETLDGPALFVSGTATGMLQPLVDYRLVVQGMNPASNQFEGSGFQFELRVVPEPAPGLLFAVALVGTALSFKTTARERC